MELFLLLKITSSPTSASHIANAGYMTMPGAFGKGIGKAMGEFSIAEAKRLGYKAIQFNIVVKRNKAAISLWEKLGFNIIWENPDAFYHQQNRLTNAYVMYRKI